MLIGNVAVPYGVQIIVHSLGVDLLEADRDPPTGLYNRRAFCRRTAALATAGHGGGMLLIAIKTAPNRTRSPSTRRWEALPPPAAAGTGDATGTGPPPGAQRVTSGP